MARRPDNAGAPALRTIFVALAAAAASIGTALAQVALPPSVEQSALARDPFSTGVLTPGQGPLPATLWRGADVDAVARLLAAAPSRPAAPAIGDLLRVTLLTAGETPRGAGDRLGGAKLIALARAGFAEEARTVASLSDASRNDSHIGRALATADLLAGDGAAACARNAALTEGRDAPFWVRLRVYCYAVAGEIDAADLTLGVLRDQGALSEADIFILTALATGAPPATPPAPEDALHLAALRHMKIAPTPSMLTVADGGVVKAVASDGAVEPVTRIDAAVRAAAMGVMDKAELTRVFDSVALDVADIASARQRAVAAPGDLLTDVALHRAVGQMTAPEFLRDKAALIADAISVADGFSRLYATALLYDDAIRELDGALVSPREAGRFGLARMAVGDGDGAARWLYAMLGGGPVSALDDADAMAFIELASLLGALDPAAAARLAETAGVALTPREIRRPSRPSRNGDDEALAQILAAAFDATRKNAPGQAALAALAASNVGAPGDRLAEVVVEESLAAAGLDRLRRRLALERALADQFGSLGAPTRGLDEPRTDGELAPRLKPARRASRGR